MKRVNLYRPEDYGFEVQRTASYRRGVSQLREWHRMCADRREGRWTKRQYKSGLCCSDCGRHIRTTYECGTVCVCHSCYAKRRAAR